MLSSLFTPPQNDSPVPAVNQLQAESDAASGGAKTKTSEHDSFTNCLNQEQEILQRSHARAFPKAEQKQTPSVVEDFQLSQCQLESDVYHGNPWPSNQTKCTMNGHNRTSMRSRRSLKSDPLFYKLKSMMKSARSETEGRTPRQLTIRRSSHSP